MANFKRIYGLIRNPVQLKRHLTRLLSSYRDVIVMSIPKSGRTWFRLLLEKLHIQPIMSHDDSSWEEFTRSHESLETDKTKYKNNRIIFLVRDPRDVVVSSYFHATRRNHYFDESISDFIRNDEYGIKKILRFHEIWEQNRHIPKDFLLVKYEDMHEDAFRELQRVLHFLNYDTIHEQLIRDAIEACKFDRMHAQEKSGKFANRRYGDKLKPKNVKDPESFKTRKGKVGGYTEYLNEKDIAYCNECMRTYGNPYYPLGS